MPRYSEKTDEGPLDFPFCPGCHEIQWGEICSWCDGDSIATWEPEDAA